VQSTTGVLKKKPVRARAPKKNLSHKTTKKKRGGKRKEVGGNALERQGDVKFGGKVLNAKTKRGGGG